MTLAFNNPVWHGAMADPFVLEWRGAYYAYGTGERQADGRVFPLLRSTDLARWEPLGGALTPIADPGALSYWAPEVAERDGAFYLYYSAGGHAGEDHRLRVAVADRPEGPFEDAGRVLLPDEPFSIDAHPFQDPQDSRRYLYFARDFFDGRAGTGTAVAPLSEDMLSLAGPVTTVVRAQWDWQIFERNRYWYGRTWETWHTVEGPFVVFQCGRYWCFYSGGRWETSDYGVSCAVADHPLGPWRDEWSADGPTVLRGTAGPLLGPGHNSIVRGPDGVTDCIVFHAWDPGWTARRMCLAPLVWTPEGPRLADRP